LKVVSVAEPNYVAPVLSYGALDRSHLTKHLLELARDVGVDKVTMRGLAAHAGTSASSVYYHVKDKSEMLDLLIDAVVESIEIPTSGDWEQRLIELYVNAWRVLITVPGIAALLQQRPHTEAADNMDRETRKILHESGLLAKDFGAAHAVLYIHLLGSVELEHRRQPGASLAAEDMESVFSYGLKVILAGLKQI
jgi:AcrR family transcriptional regulator